MKTFFYLKLCVDNAMLPNFKGNQTLYSIHNIVLLVIISNLILMWIVFNTHYQFGILLFDPFFIRDTCKIKYSHMINIILLISAQHSKVLCNMFSNDEIETENAMCTSLSTIFYIHQHTQDIFLYCLQYAIGTLNQ